MFDHFYSVVYRGTSMTSIHGGVLAIEPYFDHGTLAYGASRRAGSASPHAGPELNQDHGQSCGMLAPLLMRSFGWPEDRAVALTDRMKERRVAPRAHRAEP